MHRFGGILLRRALEDRALGAEAPEPPGGVSALTGNDPLPRDVMRADARGSLI